MTGSGFGPRPARSKFIKTKPARDRDGRRAVFVAVGDCWDWHPTRVTRLAFVRECSDLNGMARDLEGRKIILF